MVRSRRFLPSVVLVLAALAIPVLGDGATAQHVIPEYTTATAPATCTDGAVAMFTDDIRGLWKCKGNSWFSITGSVNVKDFGCAVDNSTDDTTCWNTIFTLLSTPSARPLNIVMPPGRSSVTGLTIRPNSYAAAVRLHCDVNSIASTASAKDCKIVYNGVVGGTVLNFAGLRRLMLENVWVDGNSKALVGIQMQYDTTNSKISSSLLLDNVVVSGFTGTDAIGVWLGNDNNSQQASELTIRRLYLVGPDTTDAQGIRVSGNTAVNLYVYDSEIFQVGYGVKHLTGGVVNIKNTGFTARTATIYNTGASIINLDGSWQESGKQFLYSDPSTNPPKITIINSAAYAELLDSNDCIIQGKGHFTILGSEFTNERTSHITEPRICISAVPSVGSNITSTLTSINNQFHYAKGPWAPFYDEAGNSLWTASAPSPVYVSSVGDQGGFTAHNMVLQNGSNHTITETFLAATGIATDYLYGGQSTQLASPTISRVLNASGQSFPDGGTTNYFVYRLTTTDIFGESLPSSEVYSSGWPNLTAASSCSGYACGVMLKWQPVAGRKTRIYRIASAPGATCEGAACATDGYIGEVGPGIGRFWDIGQSTTTRTVPTFNTTGIFEANAGFSTPRELITQTGGGTIQVNTASKSWFIFDVTDTTAFTVGPPLHARNGQRVKISVTNSAGAALGTITWNAAYKNMTNWANPSAGNTNSVTFYCVASTSCYRDVEFIPEQGNGMTWGASTSIGDGGFIGHGAGYTPTSCTIAPSIIGTVGGITDIGAASFTVYLRTVADTHAAAGSQTVRWQCLK